MNKILIIDDHDIIRAGLTTMLAKLFDTCEVSEARSGAEALTILREGKFSLVILDIHLPDTDGLVLLNQILKQFEGIRILIFSMTSESNYGIRFLNAGAFGFVSKSAPVSELSEAIRTVLNGHKYYSPDFLELVTSGARNSSANPFERLSPKEFEVCMLLMRARSGAEVARLLGLSLSSIGSYKTRLMRKLHVHNLIELSELGRQYKVFE